MTAKEFLQQALDLDKQIEVDMLEACRLRALAEKCTTSFSHEARNTQQRNRMEDAIIKLNQLEDEVIDNIHKLVRVKRDILGAIGKLKRHEERRVLMLRYIEGLKWEKIAVEMNYGWAQIHRIHYNALINIENMIHNDTFFYATL